MNHQTDTRNRCRGGKSDLILVCVIAVVITAALLWTLFKIVNQSEEHVKDVKKTKVSYSAPLQWHPEENDCDVKIKADFEKNPDATKGKYSRYDLTENSLKYIARMHKLKTLNLKESTIEDDWLKYLENLPLVTLSLYGTKISDRGLSHIAKIKTLRQLDLTDADVTDVGMEMLTTLPELENLQLTRTAVTNDGIIILKKAPKIKNLELSDTNVTAACFSTLASFPHLQRMELAGTPVKPADLAHLRRLNLTELVANRSEIGDAEAEELAKFPKLVNLEIDENPITDAGTQKFKTLKTLWNLHMRGCPNVSKKMIAELQKALPKCQIKYNTTNSKSIKFGDGIINDI